MKKFIVSMVIAMPMLLIFLLTSPRIVLAESGGNGYKPKTEICPDGRTHVVRCRLNGYNCNPHWQDLCPTSNN